MRQVIFSGTSNNLHQTVTEYSPLRSQRTKNWDATEEARDCLCGAAGRLCALRVFLTAAPTSTHSRKFTVFVNGVASLLTTTITGTATTGIDAVNAITIAAGDELSLETDPTGTPAAGDAFWSVVFESDVDKYSNLMGGSVNLLQTSQLVTEYNFIDGGYTWTTTLADREVVAPHAGTLRNFYVKLTVAPDSGAGTQSHILTVMKNGVATGLTVTISDTATTGSDTSNTVDVAAGDLLAIKSTVSGLLVTASAAEWGLTFESDNDNQSCVLGGSGDTPQNDEFNWIDSCSHDWNATSNSRRSLTNPCIIRNLYIESRSAPGASHSRIMTLFINGVATSLSATISDTGTTGNDTTNVVEVGEGDRINIKHTVVEGGTPPAIILSPITWGMTVETAVPSLAMRGEGT
jgi:hypothetical protein